MFKSFRVGSVLGIPLRLDITFLLILPVFAYIIGAQVELLLDLLEPVIPVEITADELVDGHLQWALGLAGALGLFLCVGLHELGHSVAAMRYAYHIESITLWIFGGIAQLTDTPEHWRHEFVIALAGPVVSLALGALTYLPLLVYEWPAVVTFLLAYLAVMNVALAGFNMLPAFPMDGGRVLRALLARNRSLPRATKLASEIGKLFAVLIGIFGLFTFNIILIGIAFFVYIAASGETERVMMEAALGGVRVDDVMTPADEVHVVHPQTTIAELLDRMFAERYTAYPVVANHEPIGMVTLADAQQVQEFERQALEVRDVMSREMRTVAADGDAMDAIVQMQQAGVDRLFVVDRDGDFVGVVSHSDLIRVFHLMRESGDWDRTPRSERSLQR